MDPGVTMIKKLNIRKGLSFIFCSFFSPLGSRRVSLNNFAMCLEICQMSTKLPEKFHDNYTEEVKESEVTSSAAKNRATVL